MVDSSERDRYQVPNSDMVIDDGIAQLWVLDGYQQEAVLAEAMRRYDSEHPETASYSTRKLLGIERYRAADLVRGPSVYHSSKMNRLDLLAAFFMRDLDVYPRSGLKHLEPDALKIGFWDSEGMETQSGYFEIATTNLVNRGDRKGRKQEVVLNMLRQDMGDIVWGKPINFQDVSELEKDMFNQKVKADHYPADFKESRGDLGFVMNNNSVYLIGLWPLLRMTNLTAKLKTRSGPARLGANSALNSDWVHPGFCGVVAAEAIIFSPLRTIMYTRQLPFQMEFEYSYIPPSERDTAKTYGTNGFKRDTILALVARDWKVENLKPKPQKIERTHVYTWGAY